MTMLAFNFIVVEVRGLSGKGVKNYQWENQLELPVLSIRIICLNQVCLITITRRT